MLYALKKFRRGSALVAALACLATASSAHATALLFPPDFNGENQPGGPTLPATIGESYTYANVGIDDGTAVDFRLTLLATDNANVATIRAGKPGVPEPPLGQLRIGIGMENASIDNANATFRVEFLESGTNNPLTVTDVSLLFVDIEQESNFQEFMVIEQVNGTPITTVTNNPTHLEVTTDETITTPGGSVPGIEVLANAGGSGISDPEGFFGINYGEVQEFVFVWGIIGNLGNTSSLRGLDLNGNFNSVDDLIDEFPDPEVSVIPEPTTAAMLIGAAALLLARRRRR
ncbi:MAG: PEP-CTERM sorting domain-containing protein [Verrucomicrobiota bacterium]